MTPRSILIVGLAMAAIPRQAAASQDEVVTPVFPIRRYADPFLNPPPRKACFLNSGPVRKRGKGKVHRY